ncbi:hypothetical protein [Sphingopyxis panaciterrae]
MRHIVGIIRSVAIAVGKFSLCIFLSLVILRLMRAYEITPAFHLRDDADARTQASISLIASIIVSHLRMDGDKFHYSIDWRDPGSDPDIAFWSKGVGEPHIVALSTEERLYRRVRVSVDPFNLFGSDIRSIATCRTVAFGYEGEAFLCLRNDDLCPISSDCSLAKVQVRTEFLLNGSHMDGWLGSATPKN